MPVSDSLQTRIELYRTMYLIRRAEEILMAEYHPADQMRCPMHFCVGQEAMPSALACMNFVSRSSEARRACVAS